MANTPNLDLVLPTPGPGGTPGPTWASDINTNLETIDSHNHAEGNNKVPAAGLNINDDLSFNENDVTDLRTARFTDQGSTPSDSGDELIVYVKSGELCYRDALGQEVQITVNGQVNTATGNISGLSSPASAVYSSVNEDFTVFYDGTKHAKTNTGDLRIFPYDSSNAYTNGITVKADTTLASSYTITLPVAQAAGAVEIITTDNSGNWNTATLTGTANQITVTPTGTSDFTLSFPTNVTVSGDITAGDDLIATDDVITSLGAAGTPSFTFSGDSNTGMWSPAADQIGFSTGGTQRVEINNTTTEIYNALVTTANVTVGADLLVASGDVFTQLGSAATPSHTFNSDQDTGMYRSASNELGFSAGGTQRVNVNSSGLQLTGNLDVSGSGDFDSVVTLGGGVRFDASHATFASRFFTGTVSSGAPDTLTPGGNIIGVIGYGNDGVGTYGLMTTSSGARPYFDNPTINSIRVNTTDSSRTYRVMVFYIP